MYITSLVKVVIRYTKPYFVVFCYSRDMIRDNGSQSAVLGPNKLAKFN